MSQTDPDEPTNFRVTVVNSTSLSATWEPPDDANGVIISYHLSVVLDARDALYLPSDSSMEFNISATSRSYVLTNLHEFATYSLSLAAATTVGIGNYTEPQLTTTLMAGENCVLITMHSHNILRHADNACKYF